MSLIFLRVFKRVLPLPNGNWSSLVDDWCCHPDPFANLKLLPRAEDCLLGDTHLLVPRDRGCEETLTQELSPITNKMADGQNQDTPVRGGKGGRNLCGRRSMPFLALIITLMFVRYIILDFVFSPRSHSLPNLLYTY